MAMPDRVPINRFQPQSGLNPGGIELACGLIEGYRFLCEIPVDHVGGAPRIRWAAIGHLGQNRASFEPIWVCTPAGALALIFRRPRPFVDGRHPFNPEPFPHQHADLRPVEWPSASGAGHHGKVRMRARREGSPVSSKATNGAGRNAIRPWPRRRGIPDC